MSSCPSSSARPGVIFQPGERFRLRNLAKHQLVTGTIHPYRGEWIEFDVEQKPGKDVTAGTRVARKRRLQPVRPAPRPRLRRGERPRLPRAPSCATSTSSRASGRRTASSPPPRTRRCVEIYKRARPGEPPSVESARAYFRNAFFEPRRYDLSRVGRYKLNRKLGPEVDKLEELFPMHRPRHARAATSRCCRRCEVLAASTYLLHLVDGEPGYRLDDQDHFANRRIRSVGELIQNQVRIGLSRMERVVRERMTTQDVEAITPQTLINIRPVVAAIKEFFGTSQLSQFMDQVNPLSGLTHRRRLSALGPGGLSRERAGFEVRDVHFSHYGRMCPIETPEGPNIGLIGALATFARVNEFGFIESPYRKVVERQGHRRDRVPRRRRGGGVRRRPGERAARRPTAPSRRTASSCGARRRPPSLGGPEAPARAGRLLRRHHRDLARCRRDEVQLMDVSPKQIVSVGTALIPFLEHDDANRALMGANMQKQAVPLVRAEAPYIGTGIEARAARDAADMILADGRRHRHRGRRRRTSPSSTRRRAGKVYRLLKFERSNQDTCINQKPGRAPRATRSRRATSSPTAPPPTTASWPWARTCSSPSCRGRATTSRTPSSSRERLVQDDVLTSIHIHEHEIDARDTKLGPEEITRDIPNLSEEILADLDERGIIRIGAEVGAGDVLVGKVTPKGETELTPEERLLRAIFGEKAREVRDTSLKVPHGETGKVIDVKVFSRDEQPRAAAGRQPAGAGLRRPEAQDQRGRQARRPPRQQGRHLQDPPGRGHALHGRRHPRRHHPQPARRPVPHERGPGARGPPRLRRPVGLGRVERRRGVGEDADPRHRGQDPHRPPGRPPSSPRRCSTAPTGTRRTQAGQAPDDPAASSRTCTPSRRTPSTATAAG